MNPESHTDWLSYLNESVPTELELLKRREALDNFLLHPEGACLAFPDLKKELISFFSQSSNPFTDGQGLPTNVFNYHRWEKAIQWAKSQTDQ